MGIIGEGYPERLSDIEKNINFGKSQKTLQLEADASALVKRRVALSLHNCYEKSQYTVYPTPRRTIFVEGVNIGSLPAHDVNLTTLVGFVRQHLESKTNQ
jgi:hypothetical protein